ncbi:hypothetical protein MOO45_02800 [Bombilactobacillus folatiphilus]|uniref:Uncharacterized protein n=1 Tax=Bombilactobacillus folatiphilus TaxID=2923362 RepID=A0ABY4PA63_9LACO|nr:hypothetical protein [Bombilactobacillus folatiphilus]UQS82594.1 hypothetical protein MOO45_02800 [Bombilactobacillus folatiphilus]
MIVNTKDPVVCFKAMRTHGKFIFDEDKKLYLNLKAAKKRAAVLNNRDETDQWKVVGASG